MTSTNDELQEITDQGPARALIYLRVSTKEQAGRGGQEEGFSIPAQREACMRKAASLGAVVVDEFVDAGESARSSKRPELQRMLKVIQSESFDHLIVHKIDRLARNRADDVEINLALKAAGLTLVSCTENIDETPSGTLLHGIMSSIAEFYSRNLANEVMKGQAQKVKNGGTIGRVPPGYLNVTKRVEGREIRTVEADPDRADHVRWAFDAYATGDYTLLRLLDELDARGMTCAPSASLPERPLSRSTLNRMLRNPYYIGLVTWQGVRHDGNHEPLISRELWLQVQAVLDTHNVGEKQRKFPHYLKGSIYCGACGSRLCFDQKTNRHGSTYQYFFCVGRHQKRTDCDRRYVSVDEIDAQVEEKWRHVQLHPKYAKLLRTILAQDLEEQREGAEHTKRVAGRKRQNLEAQRQKLLDAYYADSMPLDLFRTEQARITRELDRVEKQLAGAELSFKQIEATLERCLHFATHCNEMYRQAAPKLRRQMNQAVFEKFYVDEDGVLEARLAEPFHILLNPHLLVETEDEAEAVVKVRSVDAQPASETVDPIHRNRQWSNGTPTWLRDGKWWDRICRVQQPLRNSHGSHGHAPTPVLVGLGSKQSHLADPSPSLDSRVRRRHARDRGLEMDLVTSCHEPGWSLDLTDLGPRSPAARHSLFALADGCIGTSGAVLAGAGVDRWVIAAGVYDGESSDSHLLAAPVAFHLALDVPDEAEFRRVLNLHAGVVHEVMTAERGYRSARFSSLARPGVVAMRVEMREPVPAGPALLPPADTHALDAGVDRDIAWMRVAASTGGIAAAVMEEHALPGEGATSYSVDRFVAYHPDPQVLPDPTIAVDRVQAAKSVGFDGLLDEHCREWATRWENADVVIEGDDDLQLATRFALFHLMGTSADRGEAAVGARGLSGAGYHGHVFWDADTFVLPFLAATHPAAARAMLEYRIRRLPVAQAAARAAGHAGARFPWESARTGDDVTPASVKDATGQVVPIRTGELEEHIVGEVAWAACCYVDWTGDEEFASGPGLGLLVETARYWASRIRRERDGSTHIYGVIGPDEYHEPVDDNAFTNVIARWNLRRAAFEVRARGNAEGVAQTERARWLELADTLVDGYDPATEIYEQFGGFDGLEPLVISEIARRPVAADALLGADRVRGAQVVKQADVMMLYHLVPDEMIAGTLEPNLGFYEPRTAHGSSLSPAIHAGLFARAGEFDRAVAALRVASRIDLDDLTGTTAGGLHIATMGGLWQALAFGFLGLRPRAGVLHLDPRLPPAWTALELRVRFRGSRLVVRCEHDHLSVGADAPAAIAVGGEVFRVTSGGINFRRRGNQWVATS